MAPVITAGVLADPEDFGTCVVIYEQAFGLTAADGSLNPRLLTGLSRNSGIIVGVRADGELVGFALSFLARDGDGRLYQYSQTAAVRPGWQGRGIGRTLKYAQRDAALASGISLLRWTFDPLRPGNGHFNLDVLGGVVTALIPDMYGALGAPVERGEPSDRFLVDWNLAAPAARPARAPAPGRMRPGDLRRTPAGAWLAVPADWPAFRRAVPGEAKALRERITGHAADLLAAGLVAVSCVRSGDVAGYLFTRRETA